jgi:hypothetical protein
LVGVSGTLARARFIPGGGVVLVGRAHLKRCFRDRSKIDFS